VPQDGFIALKPIIPSFHYSIIPTFSGNGLLAAPSSLTWSRGPGFPRHIKMNPVFARLSVFLIVFFVSVLVPGFVHETLSGAEERGANREFRFPKLNPAHEHMRLLLENAVRYVDPIHGIADHVSGYPAEGWNPPLRTFTQLTAIGKWTELLANIAAGYADNPYISRESALSNLSLVMKSLRADQKNPSLSARGLLVNFISIDGAERTGPLQEDIEKREFIETFGEKEGSAIWQALVEKGWILPEGQRQRGKIKRSEQYGAVHFDGVLAPFAQEPLKSSIMGILDQRVVLVIFGDNVNLTASLAKSVGALMKPEIKDHPQASALRGEMESFVDAQKCGYEHLFDPQTGTFYFGWNATTDRMVGWDDGQGNWVGGQMNYFINEFRGPWILTVLRYGLPEASIRNAGFKIKPYKKIDGRDIHALAAWEGSAFQLLGLSLFMQENLNSGWTKSLENIIEIELDYSRRKNLPGFLSESYSGNGAEYTGHIGIPDIAVTDKPLISHAPSLYTLGVAYMVAPEKIEGFLAGHWPMISGLLTSHGPWEGYNTSTREPIAFQTTAHTLSLILGGIGSAHDNMNRYLTLKGLTGRLENLYEPGGPLNLFSPGNQVTPWTADHKTIHFKRQKGGCRFQALLAGTCGIKFEVPEDRGISLSNGTLRIRYRTKTPVENALLSVRRAKDDPFPKLSIPIEIFTRFEATNGGEKEIEIVLPATPALHGIKEFSLVLGNSGEKTPVDISISRFDFHPFASGLSSSDKGRTSKQ